MTKVFVEQPRLHRVYLIFQELLARSLYITNTQLDMENVNVFTQAYLFNPKFYPKTVSIGKQQNQQQKIKMFYMKKKNQIPWV